MATTSEVKAALDDIATAIRTERNAAKVAKARITAVKNDLNALPTTHAAVITEIGTFDAESGTVFEKLAIAELAALTTEFLALKTKATTAETGLAAIDFTT